MHYLSWIIICWSFWVGKRSFTLLSVLRHALYDVNSLRCLRSQNIEYAAYWRVGVRWQIRRKAAQSSFHSMRGVTQVKRSSNLLCTLSIKHFEHKHHNHRVLPHGQLPPFTSVTYTFRPMLWTIFSHTKTKKTTEERTHVRYDFHFDGHSLDRLPRTQVEVEQWTETVTWTETKKVRQQCHRLE